MKKRKDGRYATNVTVGYDETGKRKIVRIYGKTKAELELNRAKVLVDVDHRTYVTDKTVTFCDYAQKWLRKKTIEITDNSMYEQVLRLHTTGINDLPLIEITPDDCQELINKAAKHPRTCQKIKITLNQVFRSAIQSNLLYKNPATGISLPKYKSKPKRALSGSEKAVLDKTVFTPREQLYVTLLRFYGLRKEEALALKKEDFDFEHQTITIRHAVHFKNNRPTEKETKNEDTRILYIFPDHVHEFMAFILSCNDSDPHLFRNLSKGGWITHQSFRRMFYSISSKMKRTAAEMELDLPDNLTSHIFRHGFATDLYYAGVGLKDAQYLLGHRTASVTMNIYTHLDNSRTDARDKLINYHKQGK